MAGNRLYSDLPQSSNNLGCYWTQHVYMELFLRNLLGSPWANEWGASLQHAQRYLNPSGEFTLGFHQALFYKRFYSQHVKLANQYKRPQEDALNQAENDQNSNSSSIICQPCEPWAGHLTSIYWDNNNFPDYPQACPFKKYILSFFIKDKRQNARPVGDPKNSHRFCQLTAYKITIFLRKYQLSSYQLSCTLHVISFLTITL